MKQQNLKSRKKHHLFHEKFTLIELLVVIVILTILAGMLLPALNNAKARAHTIDCLGREKQMGQAIYLYAGDYKDFIPPCTGPEPNGDLAQCWIYKLNIYIKQKYTNYVKRSGFWVCPAFPKLPTSLTCLTNYGYNQLAGWNINSEYQKPRMLSRFIFPSKTIIMSDRAMPNEVILNGIADTTTLQCLLSKSRVAVKRHAGLSNYLMIDGHAASLPDSLIKDKSFDAMNLASTINYRQ